MRGEVCGLGLEWNGEQFTVICLLIRTPAAVAPPPLLYPTVVLESFGITTFD